MNKYSAPVLFIIFNKIEETKKVFQAIREYRPEKLFIASDGPRHDIPEEKKKCELIRAWVLQQIDWPCTVKTLFRQENVGCGKGPSLAIDWFFEHVSEGIILEDDCLPNKSFFDFCNALLVKYRDNHSISAISGNNFQTTQPMFLEEDYYFSVFPSSWGWATWKRAWTGFDFKLDSWDSVNQRELLQFLFPDKKFALWWQKKFNYLYREQPQDMWDFQFHYHSMKHKRLAIIPKANLVSNIGHGENGTHFQNPDNSIANLPTYNLELPLRHPDRIIRNYNADVEVQKMLFGQVEIVKLMKQFKRLLKSIIQ
ncbi:hemolytic protein HlpA [Spirosoma harenae]